MRGLHVADRQAVALLAGARADAVAADEFGRRRALGLQQRRDHQPPDLREAQLHRRAQSGRHDLHERGREVQPRQLHVHDAAVQAFELAGQPVGGWRSRQVAAGRRLRPGQVRTVAGRCPARARGGWDAQRLRQL